MTEIWKDIRNYEGIYQVSNKGNVKSFRFGKEKILKLTKNNWGYLQVNMYIDGVPRMYKIHRLVCDAFLPNPENKDTVNHKNGIKTDNRVENLEWCTQKENVMHSFATRLKIVPKGKGNPLSIPICRFLKTGEYIDEFAGFWEAERETGINKGNINQCCKGKLKSAGGYIWRYK